MSLYSRNNQTYFNSSRRDSLAPLLSLLDNSYPSSSTDSHQAIQGDLNSYDNQYNYVHGDLNRNDSAVYGHEYGYRHSNSNKDASNLLSQHTLDRVTQNRPQSYNYNYEKDQQMIHHMMKLYHNQGSTMIGYTADMPNSFGLSQPQNPRPLNESFEHALDSCASLFSIQDEQMTIMSRRNSTFSYVPAPTRSRSKRRSTIGISFTDIQDLVETKDSMGLLPMNEHYDPQPVECKDDILSKTKSLISMIEPLNTKSPLFSAEFAVRYVANLQSLVGCMDKSATSRKRVEKLKAEMLSSSSPQEQEFVQVQHKRKRSTETSTYTSMSHKRTKSMHRRSLSLKFVTPESIFGF